VESFVPDPLGETTFPLRALRITETKNEDVTAEVEADLLRAVECALLLRSVMPLGGRSNARATSDRK
jgi:hypothetical protein